MAFHIPSNKLPGGGARRDLGKANLGKANLGELPGEGLKPTSHLHSPTLPADGYKVVFVRRSPLVLVAVARTRQSAWLFPVQTGPKPSA